MDKGHRRVVPCKEKDYLKEMDFGFKRPSFKEAKGL